MQHTDLIHRHAMEGYKRSAIPSASQVEGEQLLDSIKAVRILLKTMKYMFRCGIGQ